MFGKKRFRNQRISSSNSFVYYTNSVFQIYTDYRYDLVFSIFHFIWATYVIMRSCYFCPKANKIHIILSIVLILFTSEFLIELLNLYTKKRANLVPFASMIILKSTILFVCIYIFDQIENFYEFIHKFFSNFLSFIHGIIQFRIFLHISKKSNEIIGAAFALSDTIVEMMIRQIVKGRSESPLAGKSALIRSSSIILAFIILHHVFKNQYYNQMYLISTISLSIINLVFSFR